jgi:hypothetical protein
MFVIKMNEKNGFESPIKNLYGSYVYVFFFTFAEISKHRSISSKDLSSGT